MLIFTKSVKLLEVLEFHLSSRGKLNSQLLWWRRFSIWFEGYKFLKLDGNTKQADRRQFSFVVTDSIDNLVV